ncbi:MULTISPECIES: M12 family metallo-peptidase [unclassified Nocardioides]|uniref:M12 family metallo-peptidase n=1 Tax=unclassified Nocardioides TaxID=2615069 RepID=UPI000A26EEDC|nr:MULTISPECIES: M12 family metallo-peptidase [unclassified Nocardioides]
MPRPLRTVAAFAALVLAAAVLPLAWSSADAAQDDAMYRPLSNFKPTGSKVRVEPRSYTALRVDTDQVRDALAGAPALGAATSRVFRVPTPSGGTERFAVQRTQVLQAGLAAAHPDIATWAGRSLDHPGTTIAMDVTAMGFHASVRGPNGQGAWYVDPAYNKPGTEVVLSYYGSSLTQQHGDRVEREMPAIERALAHQRVQAKPASNVQQRVYRLALLNDPSYADYFGTENVTDEKATLMVRVNQLYNDDLAISMVLVDGTDELNFDTVEKATGPNGPCGLHSCYTLDPDSPDYVQGQLSYCDVGTLQRNQIVLGQIIGASNYDIGHIALGTDGGGIAGLGVVGSIEKGMGCTGIPDPVGDYYAVDYVAHEMGHQFGGNHTFNGNQWNCSGGNRNEGTSVEPGSGTSVMAYAGICRQDNLQLHSDPYFSQRSISEVTAYTGGGPAPQPVEVQDVAFTGFDTDGDTVTIDYPGATTPAVTLTRGGAGDTAYNAANIEAAVEALTGADVTVAGWGYDPYAGIYSSPEVYPAELTAPDDAGFQVMFAGDPDPYTADSDRADMHALKVTATPGVTVNVGETAKGGPADNAGAAHTTGNHAPVVRAPANKTIPLRTPFTLRGSGTDPDGDHLTFLWEQNDIGGDDGTALVDNTKENGPLFRVFGSYADVSDQDASHSPAPGQNHARGSALRNFPDLGQILSGNTNARTGRCPAAPANDPDSYVPVPVPIVNCFSEFLPTKGYVGTAGSKTPALHFRLTARDDVPGGGGVGHDDVRLRISQTAGPFLVSSFAKGGAVTGGTTKTIAWKVNGTHKLSHRVKIFLSVDNGQSWKKVAATANDGKAAVTFPKVKTAQARIMVRAASNYFFDVNDHTFRIR